LRPCEIIFARLSKFRAILRPWGAKPETHCCNRIAHLPGRLRAHHNPDENMEDDMQYMALIYSDPAAGPAYGTPEFKQMMDGYFAFTAELKAKGGFIAGEGLKPVETATSVRLRGGKTETMDGPFAETKEHLGGFYLFDAPDLDTAIKIAAMIPTVAWGTVELRPVMTW
jgi:hypothetical protein